jgi:hypothetical protein
MKKIKILVDAYGVLLDPLAKLYSLMEVTGKNIAPYHFNGRQSMLDIGYTSAEYDEALRRLYETDAFFTHTTLLPCAERHIKSLMKEYNDRDDVLEFVVVSSCEGLTHDRLMRLIWKWELPITRVYTGVKDKTEMYSTGDFVIDDDPQHLDPIANKRNVEPILMLPIERGVQSAPAPAPVGLHPRIKKARGWSEASGLIREQLLLAA